MVEALPPHAAEKPLADRVQVRRLGRDGHDFNASSRRDCGELASELVVVVPDQVPRALTLRRGLPELLSGPAVARKPGDVEVHDFAGPVPDDEEREEGPEQRIE